MNKNRDSKYLIEIEEIRKIKKLNKPALFLDRDGVLLEEKHYLSDPKEVVLAKGAKELLCSAFFLKIPVIVVTNQSGISRNYFSWEQYHKVTEEMILQIGSKSSIIAIYSNSDNPKDLKSQWRKPSPGMILKAKKDFNLNLRKSIFVGDRLTDMLAGLNADVEFLIHILTGHGRFERSAVYKYIKCENNFSYKGINKKIMLLNTLEDIILSDFFN